MRRGLPHSSEQTTTTSLDTTKSLHSTSRGDRAYRFKTGSRHRSPVLQTGDCIRALLVPCRVVPCPCSTCAIGCIRMFILPVCVSVSTFDTSVHLGCMTTRRSTSVNLLYPTCALPAYRRRGCQYWPLYTGVPTQHVRAPDTWLPRIEDMTHTDVPYRCAHPVGSLQRD